MFIAFAQFAYLVLGSVVSGYKSFVTTSTTLMAMLLGQWDFYEVEEADRLLGQDTQEFTKLKEMDRIISFIYYLWNIYIRLHRRIIIYLENNICQSSKFFLECYAKNTAKLGSKTGHDNFQEARRKTVDWRIGYILQVYCSNDKNTTSTNN